MTVYRRRPAGASDGWAAALAGFVAGSVVFYVTRTWLRREALPSPPEEGAEGDEGSASPLQAVPDGSPRGPADAGAS